MGQAGADDDDGGGIAAVEIVAAAVGGGILLAAIDFDGGAVEGAARAAGIEAAAEHSDMGDFVEGNPAAAGHAAAEQLRRAVLLGGEGDIAGNDHYSKVNESMKVRDLSSVVERV